MGMVMAVVTLVVVCWFGWCWCCFVWVRPASSWRVGVGLLAVGLMKNAVRGCVCCLLVVLGASLQFAWMSVCSRWKAISDCVYTPGAISQLWMLFHSRVAVSCSSRVAGDVLSQNWSVFEYRLGLRCGVWCVVVVSSMMSVSGVWLPVVGCRLRVVVWLVLVFG